MEATVAQHSDIQANAMAVDYDGKLALLGTRRHLVLIDLDLPRDVYGRVNRQSKWDISRVAWSPCAMKKDNFVTIYSQWADIWQWRADTGALLATLRGHTRVISDVDWSPCDDTLLATCSIDTFINIWDTRDTKKPKMTPSAVAGASQVKWSRHTPHILATAHDGNIRVWDVRNGRTPMQYITAHLSKIHSLDWNATEPNTLASSSQDATVRFWDTSGQSLHASNQISAGAPVWKARYTPFGYGMVTALMPQMQRWDNSILLWNVQNVSSLVHSFVGHKNVILDFGWRYSSEDPLAAELVTWSKDRTLRLWKVDNSILAACGCTDMEEELLSDDGEEYEDMNLGAGDQDGGLQLAADRRRLSQPIIGATLGSDFNVSRMNEGMKNLLIARSNSGSFRPQDLMLLESPSPRYSTSPSVGPGFSMATPNEKSLSNSLEQEFKLMNIDLQNLFIEDVDPRNRTFVAVVRSNYRVAKILFQFPPQYPNNVPPTFQFLKPTNLSQGSMVKLLSLLREIAQNHVLRNLGCLESCLRMLCNHVEQMSLADLTTQDTPLTPYGNLSQKSKLAGIFGTYQHLVNIPFPRTSGARFCGAGHLVTFMRPTQVKGFEETSEPTPRCLAALMSFRNNNYAQKQVSAGIPVAIVHSGIGRPNFATSPTAEKSEISVKSFYYKEKKSRKWKHYHMRDGTGSSSEDKRQMRLHKAAGKVVIQDLSEVLHLNRKLAQTYTVPTIYNYPEACKKNREAAESVGRNDLVELWQSLELIQSSVLNEKSTLQSRYQPWASTVLGKEFLSSLIDHYSRLGDVQTLAMISCMFSTSIGTKTDKFSYYSRHWDVLNPVCRSASYNSFEEYLTTSLSISRQHSPVWHKNLRELFDMNQDDSNEGSHRSNSFCENPADPWWLKAASPSNMSSYLESPDSDYKYSDPPSMQHELTEQENHEQRKQLLDSEKQAQYDSFKQVYADILDKWGLLTKRTEILKYKSQPVPPHMGLVFMLCCQHCGSETSSPQCSNCKKFAASCSLCQEPVRKSITFCYWCGHGGHADHMESWFEDETFCATGCGCECRPKKS